MCSGTRVGVLYSTRLAMQSGCTAASSRPMIPPENSPTQCTFDKDKPSSTARTCVPIVSGV
jgi:hypothetical protein